MSNSHRRPNALHAATQVCLAALLICAVSTAPAQTGSPQTAPSSAPSSAASNTSTNDATDANSSLDAPLFYQLLIGEIELSTGQASNAFEILLDAARRTRDELLFRRAVDIALQARAGEQALSASRVWRSALPASLDATRAQVQILSALNRLGDAAEPLAKLIQLTPAAERAGVLSALPRALQQAPDRKRVAALIDEVVLPWLSDKTMAVAAQVASGRGWLGAGESDRALTLARVAHRSDPAAPGPALLAMELMAQQPEAENIVTSHLRAAGAEPQVRLIYARTLASAQRLADAVVQLEAVLQSKPDLAPPYLTLGALQLELRHFTLGEAALKRYLDLIQAPKDSSGPYAEATPRPAVSGSTDNNDDEEANERPDQGAIEAWLLLARSAEQRGEFAQAEAWLARIDDPKRALEVQTRRATMLARRGQVAQARELLRNSPERSVDDARGKLLAEASVLREVKQWSDAYAVLGQAVERFSDDSDLIYEQAMVAEKLNRLDDAESLLRKVITLKPDNAHAHNALGYSLAERNVRLPEALQLIERALQLAPGDPFITDSLGWVQFRLGRLADAAKTLRQAYAARPDAEIGAHLGEVLWAAGQKDEARRVWREARSRDDSNEALRETLSRLKADL